MGDINVIKLNSKNTSEHFFCFSELLREEFNCDLISFIVPFKASLVDKDALRKITQISEDLSQYQN